MARLKDEILKLDIVVNGDKAQKELFQLDEANRKIAEGQKILRAEKIKLLAAGKKESSQYKQVAKQITENNKVLRDNKSRIVALRKEIGITSLSSKQLIKHQKELRIAFANAVPNSPKYKQYAKELQEVNKQVNKLKQDSTGTGGVINKLKGSIGGAGTALVGLAGIGSVVALGKEFYNTTQEIIKQKTQTKQLTGLQGELLNQSVAGTRALSQTYGTEYQENLLAANSLSEAYGVTYAKALDVMEKGYLAGANASGDMLNQLEEYAPLMEEAKIPMEGVVSLMAQANKQGVFNDKGIDALKEGLLAIRERTDSAEKAMKGLGLNTDELYKQVQEGSISYFDVMRKVSGKLNELSDQSPEVGAAISDIFKGAGEDASLDYLKSLENINLEVDNLIDTTDELVQLKKEETKVNEQLNEAWVKASEVGGLVNKVYVKMKGYLANVITSINDTYDASKKIREVTGRGFWGSMFSTDYSKLGDLVVNLKKIRESAQGSDTPLVSLHQNLEKINVQIAEENKLNSEAGSRSKAAQNQRIKASADRIKLLQDEAKQTALAIEEINKIEEAKTKQKLATRQDLERRANELKIQFSKQTSDAELQNLITNETRRLATVKEVAKKEADAKALIYKNALKSIDAFIEQQNTAQVANSKKGLDREIFNIQQKYKKQLDLARKNGIDTTELLRLQGEEETNARLNQQQKQAEALRQFEEQQRITNLEIDAENRALNAITDEERTLILLQKTKDVANAQIEIEREKALEILRINGGSLKQIAALQASFDKKKEIVNKTYNKAKEAQDQKTKDKKVQLLADEFGATATFFNGVGALLGKNTKAGKVAAISAATANTFQGVTQIWKNETTLPEPFGTLQKIGATGIALSSGLDAVKSIKNTPDKVPGYQKGKYDALVPITRTDGKTFTSKVSNFPGTALVEDTTYFPDKNYMVTEKGEELIIDNPRLRQLDPMVIKHILDPSYKITGFENGNVKQVLGNSNTNTEINSTDTNLISIIEQNTMIMDRFSEILEEGIKAQTVIGYAQIEEIKIAIDETQASTNKGKLA